MIVINKKTGKDVTAVLIEYMNGKITKEKFEAITGLTKNTANEKANYTI